MAAGKRRHQIILQQPRGTRDAVGERQTTWTDSSPVWASIEPLTLRQAFMAAQQHASTTHKIEVAYVPALAAVEAGWRIKFGNRYFVVDGVKNIEERNITLELLCTEGLREE